MYYDFVGYVSWFGVAWLSIFGCASGSVLRGLGLRWWLWLFIVALVDDAVVLCWICCVCYYVVLGLWLYFGIALLIVLWCCIHLTIMCWFIFGTGLPVYGWCDFVICGWFSGCFVVCLQVWCFLSVECGWIDVVLVWMACGLCVLGWWFECCLVCFMK